MLYDLKDNFLLHDTDDYFGDKPPGLRRVRKCSGGTARMLWHAQGVWMAPSLRHPAGPPSGQARGAVHGAHEFRQQAGLPCSDLRVRWKVTEGPLPQFSAGTTQLGLAV